MGTLKDAVDAKDRAEEELAAAENSKATMGEITKRKAAAEAAGKAVGDRMAEYDDATADADDKEAWKAIETMGEGEGKPVLTVPKKDGLPDFVPETQAKKKT